MERYQKGKIYTLRSNATDKYYVGSTCLPLSKRLYKHKTYYKDFQNGKGNYISSFDILEHDDCYIELLEEYPCSSKDELLKREGELQRQFIEETVNRYIAGNAKNRKERDDRYYQNNKEKCAERTKKYREENSEKVKKARKEYYEKNKDKKKAWTNERVLCECGSDVRRGTIARHKRSQKHIKYLESV